MESGERRKLQLIQMVGSGPGGGNKPDSLALHDYIELLFSVA
jgi:hypothetical protein